MTIAGTHRGPISGLTHIHLVRESPAVRSRRSADLAKAAAQGTGEMDSASGRQPSSGPVAKPAPAAAD
jgi:hypothetical protein